MPYVFAIISLLGIFYLLMGLIAWLWEHGAWFPRTTKQLSDENIARISMENDKLDRYYYEIEKRSSGVFKR